MVTADAGSLATGVSGGGLGRPVATPLSGAPCSSGAPSTTAAGRATTTTRRWRGKPSGGVGSRAISRVVTCGVSSTSTGRVPPVPRGATGAKGANVGGCGTPRSSISPSVSGATASLTAVFGRPWWRIGHVLGRLGPTLGNRLTGTSAICIAISTGICVLGRPAMGVVSVSRAIVNPGSCRPWGLSFSRGGVVSGSCRSSRDDGAV